MGFRGNNGSGKTILFKMLLGLLTSSNGSITIGNDILGKECQFPSNVGFSFEHTGILLTCSAYENLKLLSLVSKQRLSKSELNRLISYVGLDPNNEDKAKNFSLGMKQRLSIAQALIDNPDLLILDEPTNALDEEGLLFLKELIATKNQEGVTVLLSSHDRTFLEEVSDTIFLIQNGKVSLQP